MNIKQIYVKRDDTFDVMFNVIEQYNIFIQAILFTLVGYISFCFTPYFVFWVKYQDNKHKRETQMNVSFLVIASIIHVCYMFMLSWIVFNSNM